MLSEGSGTAGLADAPFPLHDPDAGYLHGPDRAFRGADCSRATRS